MASIAFIRLKPLHIGLLLELPDRLTFRDVAGEEGLDRPDKAIGVPVRVRDPDPKHSVFGPGDLGRVLNEYRLDLVARHATPPRRRPSRIKSTGRRVGNKTLWLTGIFTPAQLSPPSTERGQLALAHGRRPLIRTSRAFGSGCGRGSRATGFDPDYRWPPVCDPKSPAPRRRAIESRGQFNGESRESVSPARQSAEAPLTGLNCGNAPAGTAATFVPSARTSHRCRARGARGLRASPRIPRASNFTAAFHRARIAHIPKRAASTNTYRANAVRRLGE